MGESFVVRFPYVFVCGPTLQDPKSEQHGYIQPTRYQSVQATLRHANTNLGFDHTQWSLVETTAESEPIAVEKLGLAVESLKPVTGIVNTPAFTVGVAAEKLGPAVNTIKSAVGTLGTQALTARVAASRRA